MALDSDHDPVVEGEIEFLQSVFPLWQCECQRLYAEARCGYLDNGFTCPTCRHEWNGDPWFQTRSTLEGFIDIHDCYTWDGRCVLCHQSARTIEWSCDQCEAGYKNIGQYGAVESPFYCLECHRIWDGRDWFKDQESYKIITAWWDFQAVVNDVLQHNGRRLRDTEKWVIDLMEFVDRTTNFDSSIFWELDQSIDMGRPLTDDEKNYTRHLIERCHPIMELVWHRSISRPFAGADDDNAVKHPNRLPSGKSGNRGGQEKRSVTERRKLVQELVDEGITMPSDIVTRLFAAKHDGKLPADTEITPNIVSQDKRRTKNGNGRKS